MKYTTDNYKNVYPSWREIDLKDLTQELLALLESMKDETKTAFKIEIPHEDATTIIHVKNAGFKLYCADDNKTTWLVKNEAMIPEIFNAYGGVQVYPVRDGKLLVMEEKFKQGLVTFVAGQVNSFEFPRDAACRELFEELNLVVKPENLKLFCSRIRIKANREGATNYDYFFVVENFEGELKPNPDEVLQSFWVPLENLIDTESIVSPNGKILTCSPMVSEIAKHLLNNEKSHFVKMLDCRQWKNVTNSNDMLHLEFFKY